MRFNTLWMAIINSHVRWKDNYHEFYPTGQNVKLRAF